MSNSFVLQGMTGQIFGAVTKLLEEKIIQAKWACNPNTKMINAIEHESFCNVFRIPEQLYDAAFTQLVGEATSKISGRDTN